MHTASATYDALNWVSSQTDPLGRTTSQQRHATEHALQIGVSDSRPSFEPIEARGLGDCGRHQRSILSVTIGWWATRRITRASPEQRDSTPSHWRIHWRAGAIPGDKGSSVQGNPTVCARFPKPRALVRFRAGASPRVCRSSKKALQIRRFGRAPEPVR